MKRNQWDVITEASKSKIRARETGRNKKCGDCAPGTIQTPIGGSKMQRVDYAKVAPGVYHAMLGLEHYLEGSGLEESLLHLVRLRASQINGCAYCIDMHWKDLKAIGEQDQRLYELNAWEESPFYSDRERAALAWTETVTRVAETRVPDEAYESVRKHFSEKELADLTLAVVAINGWNRLAISARATPGTYQPKAKLKKSA
jgi:AhpD family alkylhydroperoxidase